MTPPCEEELSDRQAAVLMLVMLVLTAVLCFAAGFVAGARTVAPRASIQKAVRP